jgi:surfactin synthase thioesterase subunit
MKGERRIPFRVPRTDPRLRLFCLPFAGGSALAYRSWTNAVPDWLEVCPVELPGHGTRFREAPLTAMEALVDDLLVEVAPLADRPVALFGHSMGARVARELAERLGARVVQLFASASPAAHLPLRHRLAPLAEPALIEELRRLGGTPAALFDEPEALALLLPIVRADFALLEGYVGRNDPRLQCPITAFAGNADPAVQLADVHAWQQHTSAAFRMVTVDEGHFFLEERREEVLAVVVAELASRQLVDERHELARDDADVGGPVTQRHRH